MEVTAKNNEPFEKLMKRFTKKVQKEGLLETYRDHLVFEPKSVKRQQQKANKLRKSRQNES
jgi:ribosomal protein S21|tara:strand:+ start:7277 stop:7459 length:183 start_codon:yes stop_codon:yes gene_type:complete